MCNMPMLLGMVSPEFELNLNSKKGNARGGGMRLGRFWVYW